MEEDKQREEEVSEVEQTEEVILTAKQERFCYEYCIDFNATQAAIRSGYSESTARSIASQLLTKVNIQEKIKSMQDNLAETAGVGKLRVLNEHLKIAYSSIAHLHNTWIELRTFEDLTDDQKACIEEISTKTQHKTVWNYSEDEGKKIPEDYTVEYVKIKLYDKQKSLDAINKMLGYDAPIRSIMDLNIPQLPTIRINTK